MPRALAFSVFITITLGTPATSVMGAKSLLRVVGHLAVQRLVDAVRAHGAHQQRVAVRRRLGHDVGADVAAGAGAVLHDELLAEGLGQFGRQRARQDVGGAAGGEGHHDAHRLGGPGALRLRRYRKGQREGGQGHGGQSRGAGRWMGQASCASLLRLDVRMRKKAARGRPSKRFKSATASVGVDAGSLDDRAPFGDFGGNELLVLGRLHALVGHHHGAQAFLLLDEVGILECGLQCVVELFLDVGRRSLGRVQAVEDGDLEVLEAELPARSADP